MRAKTDPLRPDEGFTLIETIVALVILSSALMGFYSFLSTSLNAAGRLEAAAIAYDRHVNALELAQTINPMEVPDGTFDLGGYRIEWKSDLIGKARQSSILPAGPGPFQVALYRVTFDFPEQGGIAPIGVTKLGYHRTVGTFNLDSANTPAE
jgi:prepilin-type N-terminal cleavage/methylation domain-containing protein